MFEYSIHMVPPSNSRFGSTRHSREDVTDAALAILDEHGLADLTMRRLASTLDVQASALYWHFENKQALLATLADRIVAVRDGGAGNSTGSTGSAGSAANPGAATHRASDSLGDDWAALTRAEARSLRDGLLAYRDGAEVVASTLALGLGARAPQERLAAAIAAGGFDPETSAAAAAVLLHFVLGHVSHEQQRMQADSLGVVARPASGDAGDSPEEPFGVLSMGDAGAFEFGVTLLLDGLQARARI